MELSSVFSRHDLSSRRFWCSEYIQHLSGSRIFFLKGNYDNGEFITSLSYYDEHNRINLIENNHILPDIDGVVLVHEPEFGNISDKFYLFGHIHKLQMVKQNGLNVGVDCHSFTPIDIDTVLFYKNAIEKHYDINVFQSKIG